MHIVQGNFDAFRNRRKPLMPIQANHLNIAILTFIACMKTVNVPNPVLFAVTEFFVSRKDDVQRLPFILAYLKAEITCERTDQIKPTSAFI